MVDGKNCSEGYLNPEGFCVICEEDGYEKENSLLL